MSTVIEQAPIVSADADPPEDVRAEALRRLEKKREFRVHLSVYLMVNAFLWLIWGVVYASSGFWFPWPLFPLAGWAIGVGFHAWDVYGHRPFTAEQIEREAARLREAH
jgi:2TM domain